MHRPALRRAVLPLLSYCLAGLLQCAASQALENSDDFTHEGNMPHGFASTLHVPPEVLAYLVAQATGQFNSPPDEAATELPDITVATQAGLAPRGEPDVALRRE